MTDVDFSELHDELRSVAGDLLGKQAGKEIGTELLAQAGWTGLEIAEERGGAGATVRETAVICEELGRAVARSGYLGGVVLGVGLLNLLQPSDLRDRLLDEVAGGTAAVTVGVSAEHRDAELTWAVDADARLRGAAPFVVDGAATWLLAPATRPDGTVVVAAVRTEAPEVTVSDQPVVDETRSLAAVSADQAPVELLEFSGDPAAGMATVRNRAYLGLACDSLGLAAAMLDDTVAYLGVRQQFGRPIGSFQAVKHACADMLVQIAVTRRLVTAAVDAVADGDPDVGRTVAMAKAYAGEMAVQVAGKAMQLHGGIGYTWEAGVHAYLKRATLNRALFGSPAEHRASLTEARR
ncbi:acyl-CoA dehydrogenase family protein [[Mycobacterium] wendilense]|uniref:Acyl-CoA dehydrogenase family protein n=1 Tax=[Mycobacterium] wendilense TaxID=3064284 RepID=A0ABM9MJY8_9MYCO|nr:acyl-CoA dehydrogenase family protein [Mycolicibacterium sp. MU0050]CAJ1586874.1 acyl-CoA dehydrogenase family protein [Mycolicibacterium sp. MU0050]